MRARHLKAIRRLTARVNQYCFDLTYNGRGRRFPSILVNALPKSGSTYITRTLRRAMRLGPIDLGAYGVHSITLNLAALERFSRGNLVSHQHLPAEPHIVAGLAMRAPKMVLNLRDPRAALVSWTHFINEFKTEHSLLQARLSVEQPVDPAYFDWPFADQLAWQVDNYLPRTVGWIADWLDVADDPRSVLDILVTEYAELVEDASKLVRRILDFYAIEADPAWLQLRKPKPGRWKFRVGATRDWREDYSPAVLDRATAAIPERWRDRFRWG